MYPSDRGILKTIWARRADGQWGIEDIKGVDLKPKSGHAEDYFPVDGSELQMLAQRPPKNLSDLFRSFGPADFLLKQSIVPVVALIEGAPVVKTIGTAFVVSCTGYIVTAAHVILDPQECGYGRVAARDGSIRFIDGSTLGVLWPFPPASGRRGCYMIPIEQAWYWGEWVESPLLHEEERFKSLIDIAIGKLPALAKDAAYQPLNLSLNRFAPGEEAYAVGFAEMQDIPVDYTPDGQMIVREFDWEIYVSIGKVMSVFPRNAVEREVPTPGPCFDFSARIPGRMSGAPILGGRGSVVRGVVSRSFSDEKHSYGCMIGPAMHLPLSDGNSLQSLMENGNEGIPKLVGQGL